MKWCIALLALLQSLYCSGFPMHSELSTMAEKALATALTETNSIYASTNLYRMTRGSMKRVFPVERNVYEALVKYDIKETECSKSSRAQPQTCPFRQGFYVSSASCSARVRLSGQQSKVVSLGCGRDSGSSSSSSSEEMTGRRQFVQPFVERAPEPSPPQTTFVEPPPPPQERRVETRSRGDTFNNNLE